MSPGTAVAALPLQSGLMGLLGALTRGRTQLFTDRMLPLFQLSPSPAASLLLAAAGAELPPRAWSALIWTVVLKVAVPGVLWWWVPTWFVLALAAATLGYLAGLLGLVLLVRLSPQSLAWLFGLSLMLAMGAVLGGLYLLAQGEALATLVGLLGGWSSRLRGATGLVIGLPGLLAALWFAAKPDALGLLYREGWLGVRELGDGANSLRQVSRWPALAGGAVGALQAKDWLLMGRNWFTPVRCGLWGVGLGAIWWTVPRLGHLPEPSHTMAILAMGLGLPFLCFAELAGALFTLDRQPLQLSLVAGVKPSQLLLVKLLGAVPYLPTVGLSGWVASAGSATVALVAVAAGQLLVMVGLGAAGMKIEGDDAAAVPPELAAVMEQAPRSPWSWAGWAAGLFYGGAAVLLLAGLGPAWLLTGILVAVPLLTLAVGLSRLRRLVREGMG